MAALEDLLVALKGDASGFRAEMQSARQTATGTTLSIVRSFEQIEDKARETNRSAKQVAKGIASIGGEMGGAAASATKFGSAILSSLSAGPLVAATTAIGIGIGALITKYREAAEAAEAAAKKQAEGWKKVEQSTTEATDALIKQLQIRKLLEAGGDSRTADLQLEINAAIKERDALAAKAAKAQQELADKQREVAELTASGGRVAVGVLTSVEAAAKKAAEAVGQANAHLTALFTQKDLQEAALAQLDTVNGSPLLTAEEKRKGLGTVRNPKQESSVKRDTSRTDAAMRQAELAHYDHLIKSAQLLGDKEKEIEATRDRAIAKLREEGIGLSAADYTQAEKNILDEADRALAEHAKKVARERVDYELDAQARLAEVSKSRVDDIQAQAAKEIEAVRRKVEDKVIAEEEGARRIEEIERRSTAAGLQAMRNEAKESKKKLDKDILDKEKLKGKAMEAGFGAGDALIQGMKSAANGGGGADVAKGLLNAAAGLLAAFGGPMGAGIGSGLRMFGGMFAEGGIIDGIGGPTEDRNLALVSAGEGILKAATMQKIGAPFFNKLNQDGVIDLTLLKKFANGGIVRGASPAASGAAVAGAPSITVFAPAFSPKETTQTIAHLLEPAQYRRGVSRADSKNLAQLRRNARGPRSGMRT